MLWSLAHRERRVLSAKPVVWLGTVSFGVYLWHMPVMYGLQMHERFPERFVPAIALGAAASRSRSRRRSAGT